MKIVMTLIALLLAVAPCFAQAYPEELAGDIFVGAHEGLKFFPTEAVNIPWSMPDPTGIDLFWIVDIGGPSMPPIPYINVHTVCLANESGCLIPSNTPQIVYVWDHDMKAYASIVTTGDGTLGIDAYTWSYYTWRHYYGTLEYTGSPPQWWDWGWYFLDVAVPAVPRLPEHQQIEPAIE